MDVKEIKENIDAKKVALGASIGTIMTVGTPMLAFADDPTVAGTLTTGVTSAVSEAQSAILAVLPQALVLMGVVLGITVGVRLFKRIGK